MRHNPGMIVMQSVYRKVWSDSSDTPKPSEPASYGAVYGNP